MALGDHGARFADVEPLADSVARWAEERPDTPAYTFVDYGTDRAGRKTTLSWADVHRLACATAARLRRSAAPGERVVLLLPQGLEYLTTMLGAMYARLIAVPLFSPDLPGQADRLVRAYADAGAAVAVTTSSRLLDVRAFFGDHGLPRPRDLVTADTIEPAEWNCEPGPLDDTAYLQYTSGSTREPAGVEVSHRNVAVNARQLWAHFGVDGGPRGGQRRVVLVSWLPLFHDMGFITTLAAPITHGAHAEFTEPMAFIRNPARWLKLASDHRDAEVLTVAPNFAYEYCLSRAQAEEGLDLRSLRWCLNGAEPVRRRTLDRFTAAFGPKGLPSAALSPCYGLAEATVFVTAVPGDSPPRYLTVDPEALATGVVRLCSADAERPACLVSCGTPTGQHVAIVDPETHRELPDDRVGEIWVHGPNVARGYWRKPAHTREIFAARLQSPADGVPAGPWLRTGDLGVIHEGELYVAGRLKDLIIVDGRNHFPQDIEATVQGVHQAVRPDHVAAFAIEGETAERLVVVAERSPRIPRGALDLEEIHRAVRNAIGVVHQLAVHDFVFVRPGGVPRTSSGKVARTACKQRYLNGELPVIQAGGSHGGPTEE
ncbi:fatty acyl-AMP ligase [Actinomadura vinacea]|uniref:Fatty acyl-AMP ligase n=1 Tax=Actinomadura vinacea TaxID=115336 RepID=A0ABN3JH80_9ACTN